MLLVLPDPSKILSNQDSYGGIQKKIYIYIEEFIRFLILLYLN